MRLVTVSFFQALKNYCAMKNFSRPLAEWYKKHKRDLPWRGTTDPYKVWLSEIILQQTRVEQGMSYYLKFIEHFPTVKELADAPEDKILKLWQGLGYYSRARNLHAAAKQIEAAKNFPQAFDEIIRLKGVGAYTAAAIASICFNEARAVVDGNVYRVLARVFGIKTPIDSVKGKKEFQALADELLDKKRPGDHNQAMMEFGARHCMPKNPKCDECPFAAMCVAHSKKLIAILPVKEKKTKIRTRYFYYFLFDHKGKTLLRKRENAKDIWMNLYEFPNIESASALEDKKVVAALAESCGLKKTDFVVKEISVPFKHVLSHQVLLAKFLRVELKKISAPLKRHIPVKTAEVNNYALPRLIDRYWNG